MSLTQAVADWQEQAVHLERHFESVRALMNGADNRFSRALADLERLAQNEGIPIAIVGGLGAIHFGHATSTEDIDILVAKQHLETLTQRAPKYGFKVSWLAKSGWSTLTHGDLEIHVVPEGGRARNSSPTPIPGPIAVGVTGGLGYANLAGWMELKISSGRQKDRAHVIEVMKKTDSVQLDAVRDHLSRVHVDYVTLFDTLRCEAATEKSQEEERR